MLSKIVLNLIYFRMAANNYHYNFEVNLGVYDTLAAVGILDHKIGSY